MSNLRSWLPSLVATVGLALAGCAHVARLPLPDQPQLAPDLQNLPSSGLLLGKRLTVSQVGVLVLQNNPDLRAVRAQHGLGQAQLLEAGLLPNPQFSGAILPLLAGPGTTFAWNAALSMDIRALVTLSSRRRTARTAAGQVDAQVLWQEWQVVGQARLLAVDLIEGERRLDVLTRMRDLFANRTARLQRALSQGNVTLTVTAPDLAALQSARAQVDAEQRRQLSQLHQLDALLGLAPGAAVPLADTPDLPPVDASAVETALSTLINRRPDLVALQLGYQAQEERLRTAVLSQFPNLVFGAVGGNDNSNVRNGGPQFSVALPVFDRNQGVIAVERATRQRLREEYAARLTAVVGDVRARLLEVETISRQLNRLRADLPGADLTVERAVRALETRDLDERTFVDLVSTQLNKQQEIITLEQALLDQQVAIATLIGAGLPQVDLQQEALRK